jgi:TetR/AcrR family transcriptional regulator
MATDLSTEERILAAAEEIFHVKGYDGTRMQEVADHAGINKGLLHYYFKTKDRLFEAIFSAAIHRMIGKISAILEMELSLHEKIGMIVDQYMSLLLRNPLLPRFVFTELNKDPEAFVGKHIGQQGKSAFKHFADSVEMGVEKGEIRAVDPRHLFMNMMSMLVFPFIGRPMLQVVTGSDSEAYKQLLKERKEHVKQFIHDALRA